MTENTKEVILNNKMDVIRGKDYDTATVGIIREGEEGHQSLGWEMSPPMKKRLRFDGDDFVAKAGKDMRHLLDQFPNTSSSTSNNLAEDNKDMLHYSNGICFLSNDDFDYMVAAKHAAEEAIGWKVLPENIVYRVEKMSPVQTKWGSRSILQLRDVMGQDIKVWAPSNVVRDLKSGFKLNGKDCHAFIKSLGEKETNVVGEPRKKFSDFETVYLPQASVSNSNNDINNLFLI